MPRSTPSQAYGTLRYRIRGQISGIRNRNRSRLFQTVDRPVRHSRDLSITIAPTLPRPIVNVRSSIHQHDLGILKIEAMPAPHAHLVRRAQRHRRIAPGLPLRLTLLAEALGDIRRRRSSTPVAPDRRAHIARHAESLNFSDEPSATADTPYVKTSRSSKVRTVIAKRSIRFLIPDNCPPIPAASVGDLSPGTSSAQDGC